ncbi:MAG: polysaccharide deacetylase family protein [Allosphingosinicella sp.]
MSASYLFGVDLEDVRPQAPGGAAYAPRVAHNVARYLDFLRRHDARGTFFVVGEVARAEPDLIRRIAGEGHEIACHSDRHVPLDRQDPAAFRDDVSRNVEALLDAGATRVDGYRAPCFSLTEATRWAWPVLAELGFTWSSSVLPARSPLYGWPGFGEAPRLVDGVLELPMTLLPWRLLPVPMGGGIYLRTLPTALLRRALAARRDAGEAVLGYVHPYDIDAEQERFAHPGFARWSPYNWLMYANRAAMMDRLDMVAALGFAIVPYGGYARAVRGSGGDTGG